MKKIIIIITILIFSLLIANAIYKYWPTETIEIQQNNIDETVEIDRQNRLLDCMATLESQNNEKAVVLDWNNQYSYGPYQFQVITIKDWYRRQNKTITTEEAIEIATNAYTSRELAREIILNGEIYRWKLTVNKIINGKCENFEPDEINNYIQ